MNKRDFYKAIIANEVTDEVKEFAKSAMVSLDNSNAKRATATAKKRAEVNAPRIEKIESYLKSCEVPQLLTDISKATELSVPTISGLSREQIENGKWIKGERVVKGKGKQTTLMLFVEEPPEMED